MVIGNKTIFGSSEIVLIDSNDKDSKAINYKPMSISKLIICKLEKIIF